MAIVNSIKNTASSVFRALIPLRFEIVEHEKKSRSSSSFSGVLLPDLLGCRIRVSETLPAIDGYGSDYPARQHVYVAKVIAVQLGSFNDAIEDSLLLLPDGFDQADYVDIKDLVLLDVLP